MEALLRADRFFGVSLVLLQTTQASFLAVFIMAGSAIITFDLFTEEWSRHPLRVQASQEARRLAGRASATTSDARASALDVRSSRTDRPDGMGMNVAGGHQQVKKDAAVLDVSADDYVRARRGDAGFLGGRHGGGRAAAAKLSRGAANAKTGAHKLKHPDAVRLGAEIGLSVMGPETWKTFITTPTGAMLQVNRSMSDKDSATHANARGSRAGWGFHHASHTGSSWTLNDNITFTVPGDTATNPKRHVETMRAAISETYHIMWKRHTLMKRKDKKDEDAGQKLTRSQHTKNQFTSFMLEHRAVEICTHQIFYVSVYPVGWRNFVYLYIYI